MPGDRLEALDGIETEPVWLPTGFCASGECDPLGNNLSGGVHTRF